MKYSRFRYLRDAAFVMDGFPLKAAYPFFVERTLWHNLKSLVSYLIDAPIWTGTPKTIPEWYESTADRAVFEHLLSWAKLAAPGLASELAAVVERERQRNVPIYKAISLVRAGLQEVSSLLTQACVPRLGRSLGGSTFDHWVTKPEEPVLSVLKSLRERLQHSPGPIPAALLHGSLADGKTVPGYSDCDLLCFLSLDAPEKDFEAALHFLTELNHYLLAINPIMHHGPMLAFAEEMRWCSFATVPDAVIENGVWFKGSFQAAEYFEDALDSIRAFIPFEEFFECTICSASDLTSAFDALWWSANLLILPVLVHQLEHGSSTWKRDCLDARGDYLSAADWEFIRILGEIREKIGSYVRDRVPAVAWDYAGLSSLNPGICLSHHKNLLRLDPVDLQKLGITDQRVIQGRELWERCAAHALRRLKEDLAPAADPRHGFHIALADWPAEICERPSRIGIEDYNTASLEYCLKAFQSGQVKAILGFGEVQCPGLSDLDLLVVLSDAVHGTPADLKIGSLSERSQQVFGHDPLFVGEHSANFLGRAFPLFSLRPILGHEYRIETLDQLAPDLGACLATAVNLRKYPGDWLSLARARPVLFQTLLAHLHSFVYVQRMLETIGARVADEIHEAIELDRHIRSDFFEHGAAPLSSLQHSVELLISATSALIEELNQYWIRRFGFQNLFPPFDRNEYARELANAATCAGSAPQHPPALQIVSSYLAGGEQLEGPRSRKFTALEDFFEENRADARAIALSEASRGRQVSCYIHDPEARIGLPEQTKSKVALARLSELESPPFRLFMLRCNAFAEELGLRIFADWSKIWEYPWLWFHGLRGMDWRGVSVADIGSEISPMPWFLATLGASVTLIEQDGQWVERWQKLRAALAVDVDWHLVRDEQLPLADSSFDVVTSYSVIEHQRDKPRAIEEIIRILKPCGTLALSFDICEPPMGMSFPAWNGCALTMAEFEDLLWQHPGMTASGAIPWNVQDIPRFISWHRKTAPHHNYIAGAAVLQKTDQLAACKFGSGWYPEEIEGSNRWRWSAGEAELRLYCSRPSKAELQGDLFSITPTNDLIVWLDGIQAHKIPIDWAGFQAMRPVLLELSSGMHRLKITCDKPPVKAPGDPRDLAFALRNLTVHSVAS